MAPSWEQQGVKKDSKVCEIIIPGPTQATQLGVTKR